MTCIVGLKDKATGTVYISGDSAAANDWHDCNIRTDPKVFKVSGHIFGYTTSFRFGQIVRHDLKIPKPRKSSDRHAFDICNEILKITSNRKYTKAKDNQASGGTLIMAWGAELYSIHDDFQYANVAREYTAVGCGYHTALGSLYTTHGHDMTAKLRVKIALEAAAAHSGAVCAPFRILQTKPA